jgi:hypothetical protein
MKRVLRSLAAAVVVAAIGFWLIMGANRGWTKTRVPIMTLDEVTGIEGPTGYRHTFIPGVDFLAAAVAVASVLAGASFRFRTRRLENSPKT